jgi:Stress responsive A/B Barrel Domain
MGVRHVVVFRFREDTTADQRATIAAELRKLPAVIPEIASYTVGEDAGLVEGTWDFAVVADFASEADYFSYRENPDHQAVIARHIQPVVDERASAQIVVP